MLTRNNNIPERDKNMLTKNTNIPERDKNMLTRNTNIHEINLFDRLIFFSLHYSCICFYIISHDGGIVFELHML